MCTATAVAECLAVAPSESPQEGSSDCRWGKKVPDTWVLEWPKKGLGLTSLIGERRYGKLERSLPDSETIRDLETTIRKLFRAIQKLIRAIRKLRLENYIN